ncbi:50S ribosomal protein L14e [Candidatus Woesearchaeota archaeon]|nr:50S ribosomal protein L14e [Candidatus Woesearchaeota archaeon]
MSLFETGRLCVKIAGRDAGAKCVVIDVMNRNYVLVDGQTRRRKCNVQHLEPLQTTLPLTKNASHDAVTKAFAELGITLPVKKAKTKASSKPVQKRKVK